MSWAIAKDERTEDQVRSDYLMGKEHEPKIFDILRCPKYKIDNGDVFGKLNKYHPDFFLFLSGSWHPAEIKNTGEGLTYVENEIPGGWHPAEVKYTVSDELTHVDLKKNQGDVLNKINGIYLQFTPTRFCIVKAAVMVRQEELIGYDNKLCYRLESPTWRKYK